MTKESRVFSLGNIERYLFRPLFVFFTFVMVLLAIFQASGRLSMLVLHFFEDELNVVLAGQKIEVQGLRGDWRGLNPVVRIKSLRLPAGSVDELEVELDVLESVLRNALITARLSATQAQIVVEQVPTGWRLRGMTEPATEFDVMALLRHSDNVSGRVNVQFASLSGETSTLTGSIMLVNRGGLHYAELEAVNADQASRQLQARFWQREEVPFVQEAANGGEVLGSLLLPKALSGMSDLTLRISETYWRDEAEHGGGELSFVIDGVQLPNDIAPFSIGLGLTLEREQRQVRGVSSRLRVVMPNDQYEVGPVFVNGVLPENEVFNLEAAVEILASTKFEPTVSVWLEQIDLGEASAFFTGHLGQWQPAASWVQALALRGEANNLHAYYDQELGAGFLASISNLNMQGYKGAPTLTNVQGRVWGYGPGIAMQVNGTDVTMQFPGLYHQGWPLDSVQGVVKAWFGGGYFGMQGSHLKATMDESNVGAGFAISRPPEISEQRLSLQIVVDQVDLLRAKSFVPFNIPEGFAKWLESGPRAGKLLDAQFAMHGQIRLQPGELGRRLELRSKIIDGRVEYDPRWPEVSGVVGDIHLAGVDTRINVSSGRTRELDIASATLVLRNNSRYATGSVETQTNVPAALDFVRASPLADTLSFVTPQWRGDGALNLRGNLLIPINTAASPDLAVDLQFYLDGVGLDMPEYRVSVADLRGSGAFSLPHKLSGEFVGELFGRSSTFRAHHDADWVRFDITGSATPPDVYALLATDNEVPINGQFEFDSVLSLGMSGGVTNLSVDTDLVGLDVGLPGQFGKLADTPAPSELEVQFLSAYQSVRWQYMDVNGWLHYGDEIERGALGVGMPPPMTAQDERAVVIGGRMPQLVLSEWVSDDGDAAVILPLDWTIQDLVVDRFTIDELVFEDLTLSGGQQGDDVQFGFDGATLRGSVELPADGIMAINLDYLQIPAEEDSTDISVEEHIGAPQVDPISVAVGASLPHAQVAIKELHLGDEPFGGWRFLMTPTAEKVSFTPFQADVNGVHIIESTIEWDLLENRSSFTGSIKLDDLAETLPKWDYAPSVSTSKANTVATMTWLGSPLNVSLLGVDGILDFSAEDGRFIEVEKGAGGLRILSLFNFTKLAKRINFDISDVVGEGMSFDTIDASIGLNQGHLTFPKPMTVDASSGAFQVGGDVDMRSGQLNNELIVTLPVSKSLPWYGVYLALANPLVGLGVIVGERVLRKPIEQFSTAKYSVTGTLDDPEINFVSLWDRSIKESVSKPAVEADNAAEKVADPTLAGDPSLIESP